MEHLDIIILGIIFVVMFMLIRKYFNIEKFSDDNDYFDDAYLDNVFEETHKRVECENKRGRKSKRENKEVRIVGDNLVKPYFIENQFHNDYRDALTAFNNIAPSQKQMFNRSNNPITTTTPNVKEVKHLIKSFIKELNKNIKHHISELTNVNSGWDCNMPDKQEKSGWDKQQEELGLPSSLYLDPAKKGKIKLIKIDHLEKYTTSDQTRYVAILILQKVNADDQMVLRTSFVLDNVDMNKDRSFFDNKIVDGSTIDNSKDVKIEEIFVLGFMTDHSYGAKTIRNDFYKFDFIEDEDGMLDQNEILQELQNKYKLREMENKGLTSQYDENGQIVYNALSDLTNNSRNELAMKRLTMNQVLE
jgi:hypothetical protein